MDEHTASYLAQLNQRFYERNAATFDSTRRAPWQGWELLLEKAPLPSCPGTSTLRVLDIACGNMRFARFLHEALPNGELDYLGIDSCDALVPPEGAPRYRHLDLVESLLQGTLEQPAKGYDLVACFGFMHHVPGHENRARFLRWLCSCTRPGGLLAVSFWRFMESPRLAAKAAKATKSAREALPGLEPDELEQGDRFLGWQEEGGSYRYCHHFASVEIDALAASVADLATPLARYRADGREGTLNEYLLLEP